MNVRHENVKRKNVREDDPWSVLGLRPGASPEEIRRAFRHRIKECHPDSPTARPMHVQSVCSLVQAYRLLQKRLTPEVIRESDRYWEQPYDDEDETPLSNGLFLFLEVSARDAFFGNTVEATISDTESACPACDGKGHVMHAHGPACTRCSGKGFQELPWGKGRLRVVCNGCNGTGRITHRRCNLCRGTGRITRQRTVSIRLPRGAKDGMILKLPGQGHWQQEKQCRGPLFTEIKIKFHPDWKLTGLDIHSTVSVDLWTALAGGAVIVDTVEGSETFELAPCSFHTKIVIEGKGWIDEAGNRGNHIARVEVLLPHGGPPPAARALIRWLKYIWPAGNDQGPRALPASNNGRTEWR